MLPSLIIAPLLASLIAACLPANARNREAWLAGLVTFMGLLFTAWLYTRVGQGEVVYWRLDWLPQLGLNLVLRMDGLRRLVGLLGQGTGCLLVLHARYCLPPKHPVPRFFAFLLAFMAAMLGVVLSGNLIQLVS